MYNDRRFCWDAGDACHAFDFCDSPSRGSVADCRFERFAPNRQVEFTARGKQRISQQLGVKSLPFGTPPPSIARVALPNLRRLRMQRRLLPCLRRQDQAVQRFQPPSASQELGCQPIEQLRVSGRIGQKAKIIRRPDNCLTKMMLPNAIHQHPRCQRIARVSDPARKLQSPQ